jgi:hypothetical protein
MYTLATYARKIYMENLMKTVQRDIFVGFACASSDRVFQGFDEMFAFIIDELQL